MVALLIGTATVLAILALIGLAFVVAVKHVIDGAVAAGALAREALTRQRRPPRGRRSRTAEISASAG